jgi:hypothetical protein
MLKASLSSYTIFTDVFLSKRTHDGHIAPVKPNIKQNINADCSLESRIMICYDMHEKKVMYAECDHGFVNLLLGLLTYPVCRVIKNVGAAGPCHINRSLNNLYNSALDLGATGFLTGRFLKEMLLDPSLTPFPELVEEHKYMVEDDLLIHQASPMLVMKHWSTKRFTHVEQIHITMRKHEVA